LPDIGRTGKPACKSFIPWLELLDSDFFGANKDEARTRFEDDILTQWASESPLLQACPGGCGMYAAVSAPPEQSVTIAQCTRCKVRAGLRDAGSAATVAWTCTFSFPDD
jgi:hypothetical protein